MTDPHDVQKAVKDAEALRDEALAARRAEFLRLVAGGMSRNQIAKASGLTRQRVSRIVDGNYKPPKGTA